MTKVKATTAAGGRKLSDEHRRRLSESNKARYAALTPEQQAAQLARLRKPRAPAGGPSVSTPTAGGRVNPLAMTPLELLRSWRGRATGGASRDDQ